jgi:CBS domain-containing protein
VGVAEVLPGAGVDPRVAALVGMAAMFAGASRALLTSVVFTFETTLQPLGLLPLLGACTAAYFVSCLLMPNTIMTEKIVRRGVRVPVEYEADFLDMLAVKDVATRDVVTVGAGQTVGQVRSWIDSGAAGSGHQGFPVVDGDGRLSGVVTRRVLLDRAVPGDRKLSELITRAPIVVHPDVSLRAATDHMVHHEIGRLPVVDRTTGKLVGIITRSDVLSANRLKMRAGREAKRGMRVGLLKRS